MARHAIDAMSSSHVNSGTGAAPRPKRGRYFEDLRIGDELVTGARTVTSTDIVNWACVSGEFNDVHSNFEYSRENDFGETVAHGPLPYSYGMGLHYAAGYDEGTLVSIQEIAEWSIRRPVRHGDTIRMKSFVIGKQEGEVLGQGFVTMRRVILNQRDEIVQELTSTMVYRSRETANVKGLD